MDFDIVKLILDNSGQDVSNIDWDNCVENKNDDFQLRTPQVTSALAKSLATLFHHRVSHADQRYIVRTKLIEHFRDWSRITSRYAHLQVFTDGGRTTKFAVNLVKKYLTKEFIEKQKSIDVLIKLAFALIDMKLENPMFDYKLDDIINKILYSDETCELNVFVDFLIKEYENLSLALPTIENIYICRAKILIELPVVDLYILCNEHYTNDNLDLKTIENYLDSAAENSPHYLCNQLFKHGSKSPCIFQLLSSVMKEILALKNCCQIALNFIQFVIQRIRKTCHQNGNEILDLYPRSSQCAVLLLRIEPVLHTSKTQDYIIKMIKNIHHSNKEELLILLTHFPLWLREVSNFFPSDSNKIR